MKKKLLALTLAALMALSLAACGQSAGSSASGSSAAGSAKKTYTVGICQLVQHPALDAATKGFEDTLKEKLGDAVTFDSQNAANDSAACTTICNGFVSSGCDLIMANATPALQAAASSTDQIPILGTSVTDYGTALGIDNWTGTSGKNISGTSDLAPLDGQAEMIKELFPDAKTVGILYCSGEANSAYQCKVITPLLEDAGYTVKAYTFSDSNDVASVTATACGECDVLYIPTDNTAASCTEAINNVAKPAKKPIVAGEEGICKGCGVATLSISYYDLGCKTGEMAYDILVNGADPASMEVQSAPKFTKEYNADLCTALGITPPAGYTAIQG
ncbi:MAG: ABC transporter substrate-binding protein [Oscillibacter sp.]|jgi:putative ABC transport system substrate-binding protein|nr:ABC transporter substrate-binding protein [Oscillibacter sp.]